MRANEAVRQAVFFLGIQTDNGDFSPYGTAFNVVWDESGVFANYIITARHVVDDIKASGRPICARLHTHAEKIEFHDLSQVPWFTHPTIANCDIVVAPSNFTPEKYKFAVTRLNPGILTKEYVEANDIGCGDEVFTVGLLARHFGKERNIPIVRMGNIAAMPEEEIDLGSAGKHAAYLVESRSIGGLSGSPVFLNTPPIRLVGTQLINNIGHESEYLIGVNIGLFEVGADGDRLASEPKSSRRDFLETMSAGIAVVIPIDRAVEIIHSPPLAISRAMALEQFRAAQLAK